LRERTVSHASQAQEGGRYKTVNPDKAGNFQWADLTGDVLWATIAAVTSLGDSIMFGTTKEGGCGFIMVVSDGLADKFYPSTASEAESVLSEIEAVCSAHTSK
jgi:hypothetical protein